MPLMAPLPLAAGQVPPPAPVQVHEVKVRPEGTASLIAAVASWAVVGAMVGLPVLLV